MSTMTKTDLAEALRYVGSEAPRGNRWKRLRQIEAHIAALAEQLEKAEELNANWEAILIEELAASQDIDEVLGVDQSRVEDGVTLQREHLRRAKALVVEWGTLQTQLEAWQTVFGTTQLTHAAAERDALARRAEKAEAENAALRTSNESWQKSPIIWHHCREGKIRHYPALLCSCCLLGEGKDCNAFQSYKQMLAENRRWRSEVTPYVTILRVHGDLAQNPVEKEELHKLARIICDISDPQD